MINNQTLLPKEIIIIDSSTNNNAKNIIEEYDDSIPVTYHYEKKAFPGKARNVGVELANGEWIAYLDSKTIPNEDWLERFHHLVQAYHVDVVFGVTKFDARTPFQKILQAATYGKIGHHTVPGTVIKKKVIIESGGFLEHVRMGEDIEWRERLIKNSLNIHKPDEPVVTYHGLSTNFVSTLKKYVTSAYHTARLNILSNMKDAYLSLLLIFSAIILPKWNYLIGGWDTNPMFIPNVTKIYLLTLISLLLIYQLFRWLFYRKDIETVFFRSLKIIVFILVTSAIYRWNAIIAGWMEDAVLYMPHITKIYVSSVILASIVYRGILLPLKREVKTGYIFPFRWILVSLVGLSLDLVKAPGYIIGAVIGMIRRIG